MFNIDQQAKSFLQRILESDIMDAFYGHRGRPGQRGGSVPRTEHGTKHENAQYEMEAGMGGTTIARILNSAKEHKYTAKEHKNMQDRSLVLVRGSDIEGSKFKGWQLYRYNKKDKCLESSYGDNPKLYLKDLKGKNVRTFFPTTDTVNKDTIHAVRKGRIQNAGKEDISRKKNRLENDAKTLNSVAVKTVMNSYTGSHFVAINEYLRGDGNVNKHNGKLNGNEKSNLYKTITKMTDALGKSKLSADTTLYRVQGVDGIFGQYAETLENAGIAENASIEEKLNALVGEIGQEQGFMSASYTKDLSNSMNNENSSSGDNNPIVHEVIFAPKGTKALCVESVSEFPEENEVLAQRGTKMYLRKWWKDKKGEIYIEKEIIN